MSLATPDGPAATLPGGLTRTGQSRAEYRATRLAAHRRINQRPKPCPQCPRRVQAGNLARHLRTHARAYGWAA